MSGAGKRPHFAAAIAAVLQPMSAAALLAGAVAVQVFPELPSRLADALIACIGIFSCLHRRCRLLGIALIAVAWTSWRADVALSERLPRHLENEDIVVTGRVRDLPQVRDDATRFEFVVDSATHDGNPLAWSGLVRLGWYDATPDVGACERWRLHVKLKRPRATINPGGFDAERFALEHGIVAVGSVRESGENEKIGSAAICVDRFRARIVETISTALDNATSADLLRALAFGDQHAMSADEWATARTTGIPHLIAISGLHIALFASFGVGLMRLLWKIAPTLTLRWPAPLLEAVASLIVAGAYATIAGFGLPTRRALVMIGALLVANLTRRAHAPLHGLALAVVVLLIADPLCVLSAGFWLSFVGVGWLMLCLQATRRHHWRDMIRSQGVASIGLLPFGIWFFGQSSLIAPLANLVAVPVICFFVLPIGTFGALIATFWPTAGLPLLTATGFALDGLWSLLETMSRMPGALWYFAEPTLPAFALAIVGAFWLLQPRGVPARMIGALLFLPLLTPLRVPLPPGEFDLYFLDVGQGLAMIVRTATHTLVYDTGPRYPSGFDLGEAAVVPALHAIGVDRLDRLIVSHGDSDHAGGAAAVIAAFPSATESGEPERLKIPASQCLAGEQWMWDDVSFHIVSPSPPLDAHGNDRCCVLDIRSGDSELVLDGDITSAIEEAIAASLAPVAPRVVLQAPHHGSKTSSSDALLDSLKPALTIFSAGYLNHFHHPNPDIVARYASKHLQTLNTAETGFVHLRFDRSSPARRRTGPHRSPPLLARVIATPETAPAYHPRMDLFDSRLTVHRASRTERLADELIAQLQAGKPTAALAPQTIVIPHMGMRRWLLQTIAKSTPRGIAANFDTPLPWQWLQRTAKSVLGDEALVGGDYNADTLRWHVFDALPNLRAGVVDRYLDGADAARRRFQLAAHLADVFSQYLVYRAEMILAWERGAEPNDWQANSVARRAREDHCAASRAAQGRARRRTGATRRWRHVAAARVRHQPPRAGCSRLPARRRRAPRCAYLFPRSVPRALGLHPETAPPARHAGRRCAVLRSRPSAARLTRAHRSGFLAVTRRRRRSPRSTRRTRSRPLHRRTFSTPCRIPSATCNLTSQIVRASTPPTPACASTLCIRACANSKF